MITTLAAATIAASAACSWDHPGADPYRGSVAHAIQAYDDIPLRHRAALWVQVAIQHPHAIATISRDDISATAGNVSSLRDMHWGKSVCRGDVSRDGWADDHTELAAVYCSGDYGVAIPHVCGNVARVDCHDATPMVQYQEPGFRPLPDPVQPPSRPLEVPEPGTLALVGAALVLMGIRR